MRRFTVALTANNNSGPFNIYYKEDNNYLLAKLIDGSDATGISASQLSLGVITFISFEASEIIVQNNKETCGNVRSIIPLSRTFPSIPTIV
jgi:hypothetical protein